MDVSPGFCFACDLRQRLERKSVNHILHLILSVITAGIWLIVWLLVSLGRGKWSCSVCGSTNVAAGERAARLMMEEKAKEERQ